MSTTRQGDHTGASSDPDQPGTQDQPLPLRLIERARRRATNGGDSPDGGPHEEAPPPSLSRVFSMRESTEYAYMLLQKMIEQTLRAYASDPAVARMLAIGHKIMLTTPEGEALREELGARWLTVPGGTRRIALLVVIGDVGFLYGLTSAGKSNGLAVDENLWVGAVAQVVEDERPAELVCGPFSRLVRNGIVAGHLAGTLKRRRVKVVCAEAPQGLILSETLGWQMWMTLVAAAHQDWVFTVTRLITGVLFELMNGRFPRGRRDLPLGYRFKGGSGEERNVVEPDPAMKDLVRDFITWSASDLTLEEIAERLGQRGVRARGPHEKGKGRLIHKVKHPKSAVRRLLQHLPVYLDGAFDFRYACPLEGIDSLHGQKVHRSHHDDIGEFRFTLQFGLPDAQWADADLIRAAILRRLTPRGDRAPANTSSDRKPLAGVARWSDGDREFFLDSHDDTYRLRARAIRDAVDEDGRPAGWDHYTGELLGRFRPAELHECVAGLLRDLAVDAPTSLPCHHGDGEVDTTALRKRAEQLRGLSATSRRLAAQAESSVLQEGYHSDAAAYLAEAEEMLETVHRVESRKELATASAVPADASRMLALAELLTRTTGRAPVELNLAARQLITSLRINTAPGQAQATVSLVASVRTPLGQLRLGPAQGVVRNTTRRPRPDGTAPGRQRNREITAAIIRRRRDDLALLKDEGIGPRDQRRRAFQVVSDVLPSPLAVSAILDCPIRQTRLAVLGPELRIPDDPGLPGDLVDELRSTYHDARFPRRGPSWASGDLTVHRVAVGWIARNYPEGVRVDWLRQATSVDDPVLYALLSEDPAKYPSIRPGERAVLEPTSQWPARQRMEPSQRQVRVRACPTCNKIVPWQLLRTPETPDGVICPACLRSPSSPWAYPLEYLEPWVGPLQGTRQVKEGGSKAPCGTHTKPFLIPPRRRRST